MFFIKCKQFIKNPILLLVTGIYAVWVGKRLLPHMLMENQEVVLGLTDTLAIMPVSFVFFMFLSYAFFSKDKKNRVEEVTALSENGRLRSYIAGLDVLVLVDVLLLVFLIIYLFRCCIVAQHGLDAGVIEFGMRLNVCHIFLVNLFAILVGLAASFLSSEMKAFAAMVGTSCLFSQFVLSSLYRLSGENETLYHLVDLFGLTTRAYAAMPDSDYIFSVENVEFQRVLFWIFLMLTIVLYQTVKRYRKIVVVGSGIVTVLFLWFYMLPSGASYVDVESRHDAWSEEATYYENHAEQVGTYDNYLPEETFHITKYEADLKVRRVLQAETTVYVDRGDLEEYPFALRHEYRVKNVRDGNGRELAFTQDGDKLRVRSEGGVGKNCMTFSYEGASKLFYSTSQAIRLPAYFAYLPFSGKRYLYLDWNEYNEYMKRDCYYYRGHAREGLGYETEYDIRVDSRLNVYSNLPEKEKNHFCGTSDGATLMANPYLVRKEVEGVTLIYSRVAQGYTPNSVVPIMERWREYIRQNSLEGKTIFCMGMVFGIDREYSYFGKEHLVMVNPESEDCQDYQSYLETGKVPYRDERIYGDEESMDKTLEDIQRLEECGESVEKEEGEVREDD